MLFILILFLTKKSIEVTLLLHLTPSTKFAELFCNSYPNWPLSFFPTE